MAEQLPVLTSEINYTPSAILQLFNNALTPPATKKMLQLRGIYQPGKGMAYNGFFYDTLRDETTDAQLTLIVPALVRSALIAGKTIECWGFITRRVVPAGGRIEVHVNLSQLVAQVANRHSEKEMQMLEILQQKAAMGYRDVDAMIKSRIVQEQRISITILIGKTAIIDADIKHSLEEAIGFYDLRFQRIGLYAETEIAAALQRLNDTGMQDILVIARGGGENMEIFNSLAIAAYCLKLAPLLVTAIGHKEDTSLVQQVADKAFITPTALGQYLRAIYNDTVAEMENSRAKYTELIRSQYEATYGKQVKNMETQVQALKELSEKETGLHKEEVKMIHRRLEERTNDLEMAIRRLKLQRWRWLFIAIGLGLLLGWLLGKK
jgi:exodeoxyribonuclease VII large subunit